MAIFDVPGLGRRSKETEVRAVQVAIRLTLGLKVIGFQLLETFVKSKVLSTFLLFNICQPGAPPTPRRRRERLGQGAAGRALLYCRRPDSFFFL